MGLTVKTENDLTLIDFGDQLTVHLVAEMKREINESVSTSPQLSLDLQSISQCDTAGIQLLFSIVQERKSLGLPFEIKIASTLQNIAFRAGVNLDQIYPNDGTNNA